MLQRRRFEWAAADPRFETGWIVKFRTNAVLACEPGAVPPTSEVGLIVDEGAYVGLVTVVVVVVSTGAEKATAHWSRDKIERKRVT
jgi:hypothetical protein